VALAEGLGRPVVDLSTEVLPRLVGRMATWHNAAYHRDIGSLEAWRRAQSEFPGSAPVAPDPDPWCAVVDERVPEARAVIARLLAPEERH
jgi:mannose-1-phosphate guanylyltransferase